MRFLALGDSYTIGEGVAPEESWPVRLTRALGIAAPQIIARTGWTTEELSAAANPEGTFDLVTLLVGVNDQYRGHTPEDYRRNFGALLGRFVPACGAIIVISIPDWGVTPFAEGRDRARIAAEIDHFNAINREEAARAGARYVNITPISRRMPTLVTADGLHPSAEMYRHWVAAILPEALAALGR